MKNNKKKRSSKNKKSSQRKSKAPISPIASETPKEKSPPTKESKKIVRIPTGIKNFDSLIEKGFIQNSTNMIVGGSGSGKTIFATQFLVEGLKKGEKCLYVTFEEKRSNFYKNMAEFGWDLEAYEKKGLFTFLEYTPTKVKTMLEEGGGSIETLVLAKKVSRIVIDSITSFALLFKEEHSKREAAMSLFNMISKWSCTSLVTLEENPMISNKKASSKPLEFEADAIILLYFLREKGTRKRYLEILKMRGTDHSKKMHSFSIEKSGVSISR